MLTSAWLCDRLSESALLSLLLMTLGSLAVVATRQPVRRSRIIVWTFAGSLLAPLVALVPGLPHWSFPATGAPSVEMTPSHHPSASATGGSGPSASSQVSPGELAETAQAQSASALEELHDSRFVVDEALASREADSPDDIELAAGDLATASALPETSSARTSTIPPPVEPLPTRNPVSPSETTAAAAVAEIRLADSIGRLAGSQRVAVTAYLAGLALLTGWGALGLIGLRRVLRVSRPAPEHCRQRLRAIAGPRGDRVRLLVSPRASQPFTFAGLRPVIVLPESIAAGPDGSDLRWSLAHEWSHIARGDVWSWSFAGLVRLAYYYQPLGWWLRKQLRLSQDYLADAAAARDSSPADYAEFLATRAAGRPLPIGLGIASGPSDIYRRVTMLLKSPRPLETRCPWSWAALSTMVATAAIFLAATFGDRAEALAAQKRTKPGTKSAPPAATGQDDAPAAPPRTSAQSPTDEQKRLLQRLGTRSSMFSNRTMQFQSKVWQPHASEPERHFALSVTDAGWVLRPGAGASSSETIDEGNGPVAALSSEFILVQQGRCWKGLGIVKGRVGDDGSQPMTFNPLHVARDLQVRYAESASDLLEHDTPYGMGTIYYASGRRFVEKHAAEAQFTGSQKIGPHVCTVIEWRVAPEEAAEAFPDENQFLKLGGVLRVLVVPARDDLVRRIEGIDKFGTTQFVADCLAFDTDPILQMGPTVLIQSGGKQTRFQVTHISAPGETVPPEAFSLKIPVGLPVEDLRRRSRDQYVLHGRFAGDNVDEYPLRQFKTTVDYPQGFPEKLLAELDRDVIPWDQARAAFKQAASAGAAARMSAPMMAMNAMMAPAGSATSSPFESLRLPASDEGVPPHRRPHMAAPQAPVHVPATATGTSSVSTGSTAEEGSTERAATSTSDFLRVPRDQIRFNGKTFEDWKLQLVSDLDTETRVRSVMALAAFARKGFSSELATLIDQTLVDDLLAVPDHEVAAAACAALAATGLDGLPALKRLRASEHADVEAQCLQAIAAVAATHREALPELLAAMPRDPVVGASDKTANSFTICQTLARYYMDAPEAAEAVTRAFLNGTQPCRMRILQGVRDSKLPTETFEPLLLKAIESDDSNIRRLAMGMLARRGPDSKEVIAALTHALVESGSSEREQIVQTLKGGSGGSDPRIAVPILIAGIDDPSSYGASGTQIGGTMIRALGMFGPQASPAVPVLIKALDNQLPRADCNLQLDAAETLGKIGPAAAEALFRLRTLLESPPELDRLLRSPDDGQEYPHVIWQRQLRAAIRRIEAP